MNDHKTCLSCDYCGRSTHRHGRTAWVCRTFGFDIDASTVPGKTIGCEYFKPRSASIQPVRAANPMPDYLL